jgi:hypothetical protein
VSRVYFHSPSGEAELWGGELHHLHNVVTDTAITVLQLDLHDQRWRPLLNGQLARRRRRSR